MWLQTSPLRSPRCSDHRDSLRLKENFPAFHGFPAMRESTNSLSSISTPIWYKRTQACSAYIQYYKNIFNMYYDINSSLSINSAVTCWGINVCKILTSESLEPSKLRSLILADPISAARSSIIMILLWTYTCTERETLFTIFSSHYI